MGHSDLDPAVRERRPWNAGRNVGPKRPLKPRDVCRPYRAKTKGKVERPFRYIRQDFFLGRTFQNAEDLNGQFRNWLDTVANVRRHATTGRIVAEHFAEEGIALTALPAAAYNAVLTVERRVSHEGMVSVGGNLYSVPDATRKRVVEVQNHPREIRIFEDRRLSGRGMSRSGCPGFNRSVFAAAFAS